jgi:hypothetical protein
LDEAINGFTFTNNVLDGVTGSSNSGINLKYVTGKVNISNNVINNVAFRSILAQVVINDGIDDEIVVAGNTFSGSAEGRLQVLGNDTAGTDNVTLALNGNILKDITTSYPVCFYNFNAETTTADFSGNYYDVDIVANPGAIYYNAPAANVDALKAYGVYPFYTALNADGTIDLNSLVTAP